MLSFLSDTKLIHDVHYIPDLAHNFLSLGQLLEWRCIFHFNCDVCEITNKNFDIPPVEVNMIGKRMLSLEISRLIEFVMAANVMNDSKL